MAFAPEQTYRSPGFWRRLRSGNLTEAQLGFMLLAPAALVLALVMLWPIVQVLWQSLHFERLNLPARGRPFIGLEHYRRMLWGTDMMWDLQHLLGWRLLGLAALVAVVWAGARGFLTRTTAIAGAIVIVLVAGLAMGFHPSPDGRWGDARFWNAFSITLLITVASVVGSFLIGLPLALLANVPSRWRWLVRIALLIPWAIPYVADALMWKWIYDSGYGALNGLLYQLGFIDKYMIWLGDQHKTLPLIANAFVWKEVPLATILLLVSLKSIPADLYQAARVDGAPLWQRFIHVTLPSMRTGFMLVMIYETMMAIRHFDLFFILTEGGPGTASHVLSWEIYVETFRNLSFGTGAAMSYLLALVTFALAYFIIKTLGRSV